MQIYEQFRMSSHLVLQIAPGDLRRRRKARLMSILNEGLPALSSRIFELNTLLSRPSVDLKRVGRVIRNDPGLSAQILRLCNSTLLGLRQRALSVDEAATLIGAERLRTLLLTCSIMEFPLRQLPRRQVQTFWQHSFMCGMLSERVAKWIDYPEPEQAYLGGLLHDIGTLPLLVLADEEGMHSDMALEPPWGISLEWERNHFGMSHCEVGRWIGQSWSFFPSFVDVFENHHHPDRSVRDPHLVGIVAAAAHFGSGHVSEFTEESVVQMSAEMDPACEDEFLGLCFPCIGARERSELAEMLQTEYLHLLPLIEFNNPVDLPISGRTS
jgi:HD-like signal output (HDOD) protein